MNINNQKVTVVTVTYNAEQFLEETIKSVIDQDYQHIEYIIIDGGSSDKTVALIKKYEEHIAYWVSESDNGIFDAMNKGTNVSTGEWINFLNAGDTFVDEKVLSHIFYNRDEETDVLLSNTNIINPVTNMTSVFKADLSKIYDTTPCFHQSQFVKTDILKEYPYSSEYKIVCDYDFILHCLINGFKFQIIDIISVNFITGGFSTIHFEEAMLEAIMILKKYSVNYDEISNSNWMRSLLKKRVKSISQGYFSDQFSKYTLQLQMLSKQYNKIAIYGYGTIGKNIELILNKKIVAICDQSFSLHSESSYFFHPEKLKNIEFEIIIIAVFGREAEITNYLIDEIGIDKDKLFIFDIV